MWTICIHWCSCSRFNNLVGGTITNHLEKYEFVNGKDYPIFYGKITKLMKPPTRLFTVQQWFVRKLNRGNLPSPWRFPMEPKHVHPTVDARWAHGELGKSHLDVAHGILHVITSSCGLPKLSHPYSFLFVCLFVCLCVCSFVCLFACLRFLEC